MQQMKHNRHSSTKLSGDSQGEERFEQLYRVSQQKQERKRALEEKIMKE